MGIFWVGIFRGEIHQGGFDWWEFSGWEFPWGISLIALKKSKNGSRAGFINQADKNSKMITLIKTIITMLQVYSGLSKTLASEAVARGVP